MLYEDLTFVLSGPRPIPEAELVARTDGVPIIYKREVQSIIAEPESGKTWLALWAIKDHLDRGGTVIYVDFEMGVDRAMDYLLYLRTDPAKIVERINYVYAPDKDHLLRVVDDLQVRASDGEDILLVIDSWDEMLAAMGVDPNHQEAGTEPMRLIFHPVKKAGATGIVIDHTTTKKSNKKRGGAGSFRKLAAVEVTIELKVVQQPHPGGHGRMTVEIAKDRPGWLRANAIQQRDAEGKLRELLGTLHIDSTGDPTKVSMWIEPEITVKTSGSWGYREQVLMFLLEGPKKRGEIQDFLVDENPDRNVGKDAAYNTLSGLKGQVPPLVEYDSTTQQWSLTEDGRAVAAAESPKGTLPGDTGLDDYAA